MTKSGLKTLVLGASENTDRYSNRAIVKLREHGFEVEAIGKINGKVADVYFDNQKKDFKGIHTVTLYLNPKRQEEYIPYVLSLHPKRIIFNPGTENKIFIKKAQEMGIDTIEACTLVLLSTNQF
ncbi:MAG: CoA-binding protein [Bacteroidia bacterium]|nr:MAG: CoA-binding protein [Bacteroidia bacterium]